MKTLLYTLLALLCLGSCSKNDSSSPVKWIKTGGGENYDGTRDLAMDKEGNVYALGRFQGKGKIEQTALDGKGDDEIFLSKFNKDGELVWARSAGGTTEDAGYAIAVQEDGTSYITGFFGGEASFEDLKLNSAGKSDIFVASYDKDGKILWAKGFGTANNDNSRDLTLDKDGNILLTGFFMGSMNMDSIMLNGSDFYEDIFITKLDKKGSVIWATSAGRNKSNDRGNAITSDHEGNVLIAGYFTKTAYFGNDSVNASDQAEIFIAKYDMNGNMQWVREAGGHGWDEAMALTSGKDNEVYVSGFFTKMASFDTLETGNVQGFGERDVFTARYEKDGKHSWVKIGGGPVVDEPRAMITSDNGQIFVTGFFGDTASFDDQKLKTKGEYDVFVISYDQTGKLITAENIGGAKYDEGRAIIPVKDGYYLGGGFNEKTVFGDIEVSPVGDFDFFVLKYLKADQGEN